MFNGRAVYDSGVFEGIAEDVSDVISMISPYETPLLDALSQAADPATNVYHEWLEDALSPNTVIASTVANLTEQNIGIYISGHAGAGAFLQVGSVVKNKRTGEFLQITATSPNTLTFSRGFAGTSAATIAAADELFIISEASLEGADVEVDTSRPRDRKSNYCQIFKKDIIISGTAQAVKNLGVRSEFDYQLMKKGRESVRDLEKAVIQGKLSGNTIGSANAYRTMRGIWDHLTTNVTSTGTITPSVIDDVVQDCWDQGGGDVDLIIVDSNWKRKIDQFSEARIQVDQVTETYKRRITFYEGSFGVQMVLLSRWMPANSMMVVSSGRIHVVPLTGRSYQFQEVARTGDARKGMLLGEYTLEVKNEEGMAKAYG